MLVRRRECGMGSEVENVQCNNGEYLDSQSLFRRRPLIRRAVIRRPPPSGLLSCGTGKLISSSSQEHSSGDVKLRILEATTCHRQVTGKHLTSMVQTRQMKQEREFNQLLLLLGSRPLRAKGSSDKRRWSSWLSLGGTWVCCRQARRTLKITPHRAR